MLSSNLLKLKIESNVKKKFEVKNIDSKSIWVFGLNFMICALCWRKIAELNGHRFNQFLQVVKYVCGKPRRKPQSMYVRGDFSLLALYIRKSIGLNKASSRHSTFSNLGSPKSKKKKKAQKAKVLRSLSSSHSNSHIAGLT